MSLTIGLRAFDDAVVDDFTSKIRGTTIRPNSTHFHDERAIWNGMIDRSPALIVKCAGTDDVVSAVRFVIEQEVPVAIRGGGHSVAGHSMVDDALVIDLSPMRGVLIDPDSRTAHVAGGATWADVDHESQVFGLATPGGAMSETGVAGLTLHGGYGHLRRKFGLSLDNVRSMQVVTADGELKTASKQENSDLFWALRGAGSNFGVVTSFQFDLHEVGPTLYMAGPIYAAEDAPRVLRSWRDFLDDAPDELTSTAVFWTAPKEFPEHIAGKQILIIAGFYAGSVEEGERVTAPLRSFAELRMDLSGPQLYTSMQSGFDPYLVKGNRYYWKSLYTDRLTDKAIDDLCELGRSRAADLSTLTIWQLGGAISSVLPSETAFAARDAAMMVNFESVWEDARADQTNVQWARNGWSKMQEHASNGSYLNFPGFDEDRDNLVRSAFGVNYQRLAELKSRFDPGNMFRFNQNLASSAHE